MLIGTINKQRDDYWRNSKEYRRIKGRIQIVASSNAKSLVSLVNKTGKDIYIYEEGSSNGASISANGSGRVNCKKINTIF